MNLQTKYTITFAVTLLLSLLPAASPAAAGQDAPSAWEILALDSPEFLRQASNLEREVLRLMSPEQLREYSNGVSSREIVLSNGETLDAFLARKGVAGFEIPWSSIDGGGGTSTGGNFSLSGTIGQPDAGGALIGGDFSLIGGFQPASADLGPMIFEDGFETGDSSRWTAAIP